MFKTMDEYIRQLTHENEQMNNQWPDIFQKLHKLSIDIPDVDQPNFKVKCLDALVDYILVDTDKIDQIKISFIEITIKKFIDGPLPSLDELVRIFCRILEISNINKPLNLTFLRTFYYQFQLGKRLLSLPPSVNLIELIFNCLQKHDFFNKNFKGDMKEKWEEFLSRTIFSPLSCDTNRLNYEETMPYIRSQFQQLYRWAAHHALESNPWAGVIFTLTRTFPTLFDSFTNPDDIQLHLTACIEPPVCNDYVYFIVKYFEKNIDAFKMNFSQICIAIEKLVNQDNLQEGERFIDKVIIPLFDSIPNHEELLQMFIRLCSSVKFESRNNFCKNFLSPISYPLSNKKFPKKFAGIFFDFILAILNLYIIQAPICAYRILNITEFYPWKQLDKQLTHLIQLCINYDKITNESSSNDLDELRKIFQLIHKRAKTNVTILKATHEISLQAILKWSTIINNDTGKPYPRHVFRMGGEIIELVDRQKVTIDICIQFIEILQKRIDNNDDEINDLDQADDHFLESIATLLVKSIAQMKNCPITLHNKLASYCLTAFNCPFNMENGSVTFAHTTSITIWFQVIPNLQNEEQFYPYESCVDRLYQLVYDEGEESLYPWWLTFWSIALTKYPNVGVKHISQFLQEAIDRKQLSLAGTLPLLYAKQPEPFHERLDDLLHTLFDNDGQYLTSLYYIFDTIAKTHPELINSTQIDYIFTSIKTQSNIVNSAIYIFQPLGHIAAVQPDLFDKYRDEFIHLITEQQNITIFICFQKYLVASTILHGEQIANENLILLINLLKTIKNISNDLSTQIFHTCQLIGTRYKFILANKRNELIPYESNSTCRLLIDLIDGNKISEENQAIINRTLDEIVQIEQRVGHTERHVENVTKLVKRQELNITNLGNRVDIVNTRVNDVIEQVEYQAREIERIDGKTLSYVPSVWGRDVCTLLNIRANNDWRLLGKRFGYSSSELKHWAMQIDPSMSLLNEWFMTHKADEATYGLVKMLKEIDRNDVEQIIRKAVTEAGELIPDDLPMEIKRLPPVFLSYQWGSQPAVLKLKTNLEQAGYACWMDIGQMGGGDKLFAQIDAGIRGAKVVICCMNTAYAQSDNCSREVHLTISTGKTLIPLQMEKQTWPPEGALGPIMSEYLFIRFYDRKANDPNVWPADRFMELLGQIRYHVAPNPDMITEQYHNWFVPRIDNLIFLQPSSTTNGTNENSPITDDTPLVVTHPQIMISYQWDYQKDIIKLYEKLTRLGYCCWLDIFQMGGGDSLFEKIDAGIRHSKCVLACVTPKYTKSINCRREMALADALKKPIVPLYLEETSAWPPAGPMAMVFAEKPYIDFRQADNIYGRWRGKVYELLLARLEQTIPEVQTENPQRRLLDMQRPTTASIKQDEKKRKRIGSAPVITQSRACSIM